MRQVHRRELPVLRWGALRELRRQVRWHEVILESDYPRLRRRVTQCDIRTGELDDVQNVQARVRIRRTGTYTWKRAFRVQRAESVGTSAYPATTWIANCRHRSGTLPRRSAKTATPLSRAPEMSGTRIAACEAGCTDDTPQCEYARMV